MALRLFRFFVVALSLSFVGVDLARAAGADALAPCERLSAHARGLPDSAWMKGFRALSPQLTLADRNAKPSRLEARVAGMASVKAALSDEDGGYPVHVEQLAPNLFVASVTEGTLECETFAFLKTGPGGRATVVPGPPAFSDQCWTDSGQAGRVFGQPAFVETSDFTDRRRRAASRNHATDRRRVGPVVPADAQLPDQLRRQRAILRRPRRLRRRHAVRRQHRRRPRQGAVGRALHLRAATVESGHGTDGGGQRRNPGRVADIRREGEDRVCRFLQ